MGIPPPNHHPSLSAETEANREGERERERERVRVCVCVCVLGEGSSVLPVPNSDLRVLSKQVFLRESTNLWKGLKSIIQGTKRVTGRCSCPEF